MRSKGFVFIIILLILLPITASPVKGLEIENNRPVILLDSHTGEILYENNIDKKLPPASITKIMTSLLAMEAIEAGELSLDDQVTVSSAASGMGGSQIYLASGDSLKVRELLKAIIIASANDASYALAEKIGGDYDAFIDMMNERAQELGKENTNFANATGLPDSDHYSTARDISKMSRELVKYQEVLDWGQTWLKYLDLPDRQAMLTNTNHLAFNYTGMDGLKTGYTREAGFNLSATAKRDGMRLISVVLGAENQQERQRLTTKLLDYGFDHYRQEKIFAKGDTLEGIFIPESKKQSVQGLLAENLKIILPRAEEVELTTAISLDNELEFPILAEEKIGEVVVKERDEIRQRADIIAAEDIERAGIFRRLFRWFRNLLPF